MFISHKAALFAILIVSPAVAPATVTQEKIAITRPDGYVIRGMLQHDDAPGYVRVYHFYSEPEVRPEYCKRVMIEVIKENDQTIGDAILSQSSRTKKNILFHERIHNATCATSDLDHYFPVLENNKELTERFVKAFHRLRSAGFPQNNHGVTLEGKSKFIRCLRNQSGIEIKWLWVGGQEGDAKKIGRSGKFNVTFSRCEELHGRFMGFVESRNNGGQFLIELGPEFNMHD